MWCQVIHPKITCCVDAIIQIKVTDMAMKMPFTIKGKLYPDAYWRIGEIRYVDRTNQIRIAFDMYIDSESRENDKENGVMFTKPYYLNGGFVEAFKEMTGNAIKAAMYQYAKEFKEGEPPLEDDNGDFIDAQRKPRRRYACQLL